MTNTFVPTPEATKQDLWEAWNAGLELRVHNPLATDFYLGQLDKRKQWCQLLYSVVFNFIAFCENSEPPIRFIPRRQDTANTNRETFDTRVRGHEKEYLSFPEDILRMMIDDDLLDHAFQFFAIIDEEGPYAGMGRIPSDAIIWLSKPTEDEMDAIYERIRNDGYIVEHPPQEDDDVLSSIMAALEDGKNVMIIRMNRDDPDGSVSEVHNTLKKLFRE